jgi:hypothetical protein
MLRLSNCTSRKYCDLRDFKNVPIIRLSRVAEGPESREAEARKHVSPAVRPQCLEMQLTDILRVRSLTHWRIYQATSTSPIRYVVGCIEETRKCHPGYA